MPKHWSVTNTHQHPDDVANFFGEVEQAIRGYYTPSNKQLKGGDTPHTVEEKMKLLLEELDRICTLNLLASIEAAFMVDFHYRCRRKKKDDLSKKLRSIQKNKQRISFTEDILKFWNDEPDVPKEVTQKLITYFKHRHWLAHGRYWTQKYGSKIPDFFEVYSLSQLMHKHIPFAK